MTALSVVVISPASRELTLWDDIKTALDNVDGRAEDILAYWVIIGECLTEIRALNPGYRGGQFATAAKQHGVFLTGQQMSAAQWWAQLDQPFRDKLHYEFPDALSPTSLQNDCRDKYPDRAKIRKSNTFHRVESKRKGQKHSKQASLKLSEASADTEPKPPKLSAKRRKEIEEEDLREELRAKRLRREAAEEAAAIKDRRPRLKEQDGPVIMYGVQMWPIADADRPQLGYYDYDQLFFAIHQFKAWRELVVVVEDHASLAIKLRGRVKHLYNFVDRRIEGQCPCRCQAEMKALISVMQKLASLYEANPTGECRHPSDKVIR